MNAKNTEKWTDWIRTRWASLSQIGTWIAGIASGFVVPPPVAIVGLNDGAGWVRLGQFLVTATVGLLFVPIVKFKKRRFAWKWWTTGLVALGATIIVFVGYNEASGGWTARYGNGVVVIGSKLTSDGQRVANEQHLSTAEDLLMAFGGKTEEVWTRSSIEIRRVLLVMIYLTLLPLVTLLLMSVLQAIRCQVGEP